MQPKAYTATTAIQSAEAAKQTVTARAQDFLRAALSRFVHL